MSDYIWDHDDQSLRMVPMREVATPVRLSAEPAPMSEMGSVKVGVVVDGGQAPRPEMTLTPCLASCAMVDCAMRSLAMSISICNAVCISCSRELLLARWRMRSESEITGLLQGFLAAYMKPLAPLPGPVSTAGMWFQPRPIPGGRA